MLRIERIGGDCLHSELKMGIFQIVTVKGRDNQNKTFRMSKRNETPKPTHTQTHFQNKMHLCFCVEKCKNIKRIFSDFFIVCRSQFTSVSFFPVAHFVNTQREMFTFIEEKMKNKNKKKLKSAREYEYAPSPPPTLK